MYSNIVAAGFVLSLFLTKNAKEEIVRNFSFSVVIFGLKKCCFHLVFLCVSFCVMIGKAVRLLGRIGRVLESFL